MLLKINKIILFLIIASFIAMIFPYFWDLGGLFKRDFYAKRIMTVFSLPFFLLILIIAIKEHLTLSKNIILYIFLLFIVGLNSFFYRNKLSLIILDLFIVLIPLFFYLAIYKTNFNIEAFVNKIPFLLVISSVLVLYGVKLQFSYFTLLSIIYIIFFAKINYQLIFFISILPFLIKKTLLGKSALIMLGFLILYLLIFNKLVNKQRKKIIIITASVLFFTAISIFWNLIIESGAYRNTVYFLRNTDFSKFEFKDISTGERIYEANEVLINFKNTNWYHNIFGNGFGATIDLSKTLDNSVANLHKDLSNVRHIHIGFFAVLHRYGIIGIILFFLFIRKVTISCFYILKNTTNYKWVLITLYILILIFDSFITFPHMMSNFIFWLFVFLALKKKEEMINQKHENLLKY